MHRHRTNVRIFSEKVLREQEFNRGPLGPEPTLVTLSLAFKSNHPRGFKLSVFYRYRIVHRTSLINVMTHLTSFAGSMIILNYAENYSLWLDSFFLDHQSRGGTSLTLPSPSFEFLIIRPGEPGRACFFKLMARNYVQEKAPFQSCSYKYSLENFVVQLHYSM